ncbi:chitin deacetylase 8-like isoform X2 [Littorina saxatilis]
MVLVTFDDYVTRANFHFYDDLFPRALSDVVKNPNGCPATATFFVSGTHTNMTMVKTLADRGHEIASHSHTHGSPGTWSRQDWDREIQGMRQNLAHACQLPAQKVCGMRAPFLELGGDDQFSVLQDRGFLYDSSMFGGSITEDSSAPPLWPFTLHYPPSTSQTVCDQSRCPGRSYPQIWEVPLIRQYALDGRSCAMTDGCPFAGDDVSKDDVKRYLRKNFDRHYNRNRAPFMISLHATWFTNVPQSYQGLQEFLQEVSSRSDVWQVTLTQMLDWVRHPVPLSRVGEIPSWQC